MAEAKKKASTSKYTKAQLEQIAIKYKKRSKYLLAQATHLNSKLHQMKSSDRETVLQKSDYIRLKEVCRGLVRNNHIAARAQDYYVDRVLGESGIWPQVRTDDDRLNERIESAFRRWAEKTDWFDIQELLIRESFTVGEGFAYSVIDNGEFLILPFRSEDLGPYITGEDILQGVKYDKFGRPIEYYLNTADYAYFNLNSQDYITLPIDRVFHYWDRKDPSQVRGVSPLVQAASLLYSVSDANEAELTALRAASYFGLHFKPDDFNNTDFLDDTFGDDLETNVADGDTEYTISSTPGALNIYPGDVKLLDGNRPGGAYLEFVNALLKQVAARLGVPYSAITGDTSNSSYSTERAVAMHNIRLYQQAQQRLIRQALRPIFKKWLEFESLNNRSLTGLVPDIIMQSTRFQTPGYIWIDPDAESKAMQTQMEMGILTYSEACAKMGRDPEDVIKQIKEDQELFAKYGVEMPEVLKKLEVTNNETEQFG